MMVPRKVRVWLLSNYGWQKGWLAHLDAITLCSNTEKRFGHMNGDCVHRQESK
ncbi:hypothetical protein DM01DRAFT_1337857 [Hesseltinella vesiculosa]|uniref:Uncharacterized protein n=1 Tax=Hesseltinella vesiculosa TaxID=101127 RepID=A0A1X2GC11_9FUNG|nr:hypothetical protein DM01DRAFT_1337857 [Hesseltinella vesiculosa]